MDEGKYLILREKYPTLFTSAGTSMRWPINWYGVKGIQCGDGWFDIIDEILNKLQVYPVYIFQIKEKFGELRIYTENKEDDFDKEKHREVYDIIGEGTDKSKETCELCGKPGKTCNYTTYYIRTVCEECLRKKEKERETKKDVSEQ